MRNRTIIALCLVIVIPFVLAWAAGSPVRMRRGRQPRKTYRRFDN